MLKSWVPFAIAVLVLLLGWRPTPGTAIPLFSHQYDVTCSKCHTVIPHLNDVRGAPSWPTATAFPGVQPGPAFPLSAEGQWWTRASTRATGRTARACPKRSSTKSSSSPPARSATRASFLVEQYAVDGGEHGLCATPGSSTALNPVGRQNSALRAGRYRSRCRCRSIPKRSAKPTRLRALRANGRHESVQLLRSRRSARGCRSATRCKGCQRRSLRRAGPRPSKRARRRPATTSMDVGARSIGPLALTAFRYSGNAAVDVRHLLDRVRAHRLWRRVRSVGAVVERERADHRLGQQLRHRRHRLPVERRLHAAALGSSTPRLFALARYEGTNDPEQRLRPRRGRAAGIRRRRALAHHDRRRHRALARDDAHDEPAVHDRLLMRRRV